MPISTMFSLILIIFAGHTVQNAQKMLKSLKIKIN